MTLLTRYIVKTILSYTLLILLVVIGLDFFISLISELEEVGSGYYSFSEAMFYCLLRLPSELYEFFPILTLLGGVIGLGMLSSHHELTVMRASGLSFRKIIQAILLSSCILIFIVTLIGEGIAPRANFLAEKRKASAKNDGQAVITTSGVWAHEGNNFFHISKISSRHHLKKVTRYEFDASHHLLAAYYIEHMDYDQGNWVLHNLVQTTFHNDTVKSEQIPQATWNAILNPNLLQVGMIEPAEMSLHNLYQFNQHLTGNGLQAVEFQFAFWRRIFQPIGAIVMLLLAIPCVMYYSRSATVGGRIFIGIMAGCTFYMANALLEKLSIVYQLSPFIAAMMPILILASLGYFATWKLIR